MMTQMKAGGNSSRSNSLPCKNTTNFSMIGHQQNTSSFTKATPFSVSLPSNYWLSSKNTSNFCSCSPELNFSKVTSSTWLPSLSTTYVSSYQDLLYLQYLPLQNVQTNTLLTHHCKHVNLKKICKEKTTLPLPRTVTIRQQIQKTHRLSW